MQIRPRERATQLLGIGIEQQFVMIEAMAKIRLVRPIHPIGIHGAGASAFEISIPDLIGKVGQRQTIQLASAIFREQAQLNFFCMRRKQGKIHPVTIPGAAQRMDASGL